MAYCAQADIVLQLPEKVLIQLTDDEKQDEVNTEVLARAIADADAIIDSYCAATESVPFDPVPVSVRKLSVDLTAFNLFTRRNAVPELWKDRKKDALDMLKRISEGKLSLGSDAPTPDDEGGPEGSKLETDRNFTMGQTNAGTIGTLDNF